MPSCRPSLHLPRVQEEDASLPQASTNRDTNLLFTEHPRPGLKGELLGDCKLVGTIGGEHKWQAGCSGSESGSRGEGKLGRT